MSGVHPTGSRTPVHRWRVVVPLPIAAYDFLPPHGLKLEPNMALGRRVLVPWQGGARVGLVVQALPIERSDRTMNLKEAIGVLDEQSLLSADACATLLEVARRTLAPDGLALADFLPFGLEPGVEHLVRLVPGVDVSGLPDAANELRGWTDANRCDPGLLDFLRSQGLLEEEASLIQPSREVLEFVPDAPETKLTKKQKQAVNTLERLGRVETATAWARAAKVSVSVVTGLIAKGFARTVLERTPPPEPRQPSIQPVSHTRKLEWPEGDRLRLHGGRANERYAAIAPLIRKAKGVLYLAPDKTSLERAFSALAGIRPSGMLHGELSPREREEVWRRARDGQTHVLFGTPMALLAPVSDLDLIVIDDEASDAYKLRDGTRVFVPDAALARAEACGARVLFTGIAPAVESLGIPGLVLPPPRARIHVVDYTQQATADEMGPMVHIAAQRESWPISNALKKVLRQVAERGRQAVLIAPRRGYSAVIRCQDCGWLPDCPNCDVPLRYHAERRALECHQCGHTTRPPRQCPRCDGTVFAPKGPGSEWVQTEIAKLLPSMPSYRFDRDRKDDISALWNKQPGIVVGTTATLGVPAPPDLALVALTFADTFATHPDFRSSERYHALLRRILEWHPSRAPLLLVQTFTGGHPALRAVIEGHDSAYYPSLELDLRRGHGYPPFALFAQIQVAARNTNDAKRVALELAALLRDRGAGPNELLGPAPAPIARLKGLYAHNLLVRSDTLERLVHLLEPVKRARGGARIRVDMNPRDLSELMD